MFDVQAFPRIRQAAWCFPQWIAFAVEVVLTGSPQTRQRAASPSLISLRSSRLVPRRTRVRAWMDEIPPRCTPPLSVIAWIVPSMTPVRLAASGGKSRRRRARVPYLKTLQASDTVSDPTEPVGDTKEGREGARHVGAPEARSQAHRRAPHAGGGQVSAWRCQAAGLERGNRRSGGSAVRPLLRVGIEGARRG